MASWKGIYSNVDVLEQQTEDPKVLDQRKWADSKENPEMESTYEPIDPAISLNGKEVELLPADCSPACWKPAFTCRAAMVTVALVLATSVSLNVLLLALGLVHYSKMVATLEQAHQENRQLQEAVPDPFLLFNEAHNACMTIKQPNNLIKVSCDPDAPGQRFQWLSRGLLRHVASQLCVEASTAKNRVAILLKPCNVQRSFQHWECRDHDLLALQGTDLYFNYGNSAKKIAMLYSQNGHWSRWLIYGTHSNICSTCNPFSMDWTFFQGSYYFFSYSPGTWDVANQSCTSMGFHLVMINSIEEKGHVATIMKAPSCWIGLTDQVLEDDWKWVDGTHIEHGDRNLGRSHNSGTPEKHHNSEQLPNELNYWHQNEPNGGKGENCASMQNSLWYDHECKEKFHWICERRF
ncbi:macrophage mannose receptor 1-like isoform X2 [Pantherophis guttatus]|uniref:Macrophage mannose receptor 1-like isoform X2 n=1 Tax=Pantherophis guttatus TaxID=94885 RepID=A0A6P9DD56_PANGU|nr:macrophage mannose receptor 1-like isoform X2 [Pantherophis guttatus]